MNVKIIIIFVCILFAQFVSFAKTIDVVSPDKNLKVTINVEDEITFSMTYNQVEVLSSCPVSMKINGRNDLGSNPKVVKIQSRNIKEEIISVVPNKNSKIEDNCTEVELKCKGAYSIIFRAYNKGFAYRFVTNWKEEVEVAIETFELNFASPTVSYFPEEKGYYSHYEDSYPKENLSDISDSRMCSLPVLFTTDKGVNVLFSETDLYDYPNMFMKGTGANGLQAIHPKAVAKIINNPKRTDRGEIIEAEEEYIALTTGNRSFPWRTFIVSEKAGDIVESDLNFILASPLKLERTDWIKPGKAAWDWWNDNNIYGVDFKAGINNNTYKYFIDFASKFGLDYIILDEGWSKTTMDVTENGKDIDVQELVKYGAERGVDVILWLLWKPLDRDLFHILDTYKAWGVKGIKVDFMQRADQYMVNYYERVAMEAAKRELIVDFHGAFKPSGLRRAYPNVINYEGVKGMENNKWSEEVTPTHNVTLPFTRMAAGPMDFTPGAMNNASLKDFKISFSRPMSLGTRCHQFAMYVVYESPLQMLCESPTDYYKEQESTEFISKIPTVWDETKVLNASIAEYIVVARRHGKQWYIGAMNNWDERELEIDLSFLPEGSFTIESMQDGVNANRNAKDYKHSSHTISKNDKIAIKLASGGGWAAIITQ